MPLHIKVVENHVGNFFIRFYSETGNALSASLRKVYII